MSDLVGNPEDRFSHVAAHIFPMIFRFHLIGLPDIKKNFYIESHEVANMTQSEVDEIR